MSVSRISVFFYSFSKHRSSEIVLGVKLLVSPARRMVSEHHQRLDLRTVYPVVHTRIQGDVSQSHASSDTPLQLHEDVLIVRRLGTEKSAASSVPDIWDQEN